VSSLAPLPVLIPLLGAALTLIAGRQPRLQRVIALAALGAVLAVCVALLVQTDRDGIQVVHVGGWGPTEDGLGPLGVTLVVDRLSALMLVVSAVVLLAVVFYAIGQGIRDGDDRQSPRWTERVIPGSLPDRCTSRGAAEYREFRPRRAARWVRRRTPPRSAGVRPGQPDHC
jgi:formate hydrogenlyase subunit 3/multisubunit Na+/H+ antiporter MnhD subunit